MPVMGVEDAIQRRDALVSYTQKVLQVGIDYGVIPGTTKPTLLKPGAEKLCTMFGLTPIPEIIHSTTDWTGKEHGEPFFYYHVRYNIYRGGSLIAAGDGSCNSMEKKYRYRWVGLDEVPEGMNLDHVPTQGGKVSEFIFSYDKRETTGRFGKPESYWKQFDKAMADKTIKVVKKKIKSGEERDAYEIDTTLYRLPNPDIADQANTILKMASKRALIAAVLIAIGASEFFTQDMEDFAIDPDGAFEGSFIVNKVSDYQNQQPDMKQPEQPAKAATSSTTSKAASQNDAKATPPPVTSDNRNGANNGNHEAKGKYLPVNEANKAEASALATRHEEIKKQSAAAKAKSATLDTKANYATALHAFQDAVNAQLKVRNLPLVNATNYLEVEKQLVSAISSLIAYDTNAPTEEAQPTLVTA